MVTHSDLSQWAIVLLFVTATITDAIIAASMCFTLSRLRTGMRRWGFTFPVSYTHFDHAYAGLTPCSTAWCFIFWTPAFWQGTLSAIVDGRIDWRVYQPLFYDCRFISRPPKWQRDHLTNFLLDSIWFTHTTSYFWLRPCCWLNVSRSEVSHSHTGDIHWSQYMSTHFLPCGMLGIGWRLPWMRRFLVLDGML